MASTNMRTYCHGVVVCGIGASLLPDRMVMSVPIVAPNAMQVNKQMADGAKIMAVLILAIHALPCRCALAMLSVVGTDEGDNLLPRIWVLGNDPPFV